MTSRRAQKRAPTAARLSAEMVADASLQGNCVADESTTGWLLRPFTLAELVNVGVYVFVNHRLKQYYVGQATTSFGVRFIREVGRRLAEKPTTAGYDLVFDCGDSEIIYERSYRWTQIRHCDLDSIEAEVFNKYQALYPDYAALNKRSVKKWKAMRLREPPARRGSR